MKRRWFGVLLMAWASMVSLLSYAPIIAPAASAATCSNYTTVTFKVHLSRELSNVAVGAHWNAGTSNTQNPGSGEIFPVTCTGTDYSLAYANPSANAENDFVFRESLPLFQDGQALKKIRNFTISVTVNGAVVATKGPQDISQNATVNITVPADGNCKASISGSASYKDPTTGRTVAMSDAAMIKLSGTSSQIIKPGANGAFIFANLAAGSYTVEAEQAVSSGNGAGTKYMYKKSGPFAVKACESKKLGNLMATAVDSPRITPIGNTNDTNDTVQCDSGPGGFSWFVCGAIELMVNATDFIREHFIVPFLKETPMDKDNDSDVKIIYQMWSTIRNVASVFFILIFFLAIFGTAIGFDNYTIKKIIPRLVAGAILIPLSWYICVAIIDIGNITGQGLMALGNSVMNGPVKVDYEKPIGELIQQAQGAVILVGGAAAIAYGIANASFGVLITAVIGLAIAFITLVLRKILITMFMILSPFIILAWVLPNTQKIYTSGRDNFIKLVMMYPLIMSFFIAGRFFAYTAHSAVAGQGPVTEATVPLLQVVGLTIPLYGIPASFKMAGSALNFGRGFINKVGSQIDSRVGRNSEWNKTAVDRRKQNSLLREKRLLEQGGGLNKMGAMYHRARSGMGTGFFRTGKGNDFHQLAREEALGKAAETRSAINASQQAKSGAIPGEGIDNRLAAMTQAKLGQKGADRAARAGLLDAVRQNGGDGGRLATEGYYAKRETEKRQQSAQIGQNRGVISGARVMPQSGSTVAKDAELKEEVKQSIERQAAQGNINAVRDIENKMLHEDRTSTTPRSITRQQVRDQRMRTIGQKSQEDARLSTATEYGTAIGQNNATDKHHEETDTMVNAAAGAQRQKYAEGIGQRSGQAFTEKFKQVDTGQLIRAAELNAQKQLSTQAGTVRGTIETANIDARAAGLKPGSATADLNAMKRIANASQIDTTGKGLQATAGELEAIRVDEANKAKAGGSDNYHLKTLAGARAIAYKDIANKTNVVTGAASGMKDAIDAEKARARELTGRNLGITEEESNRIAERRILEHAMDVGDREGYNKITGIASKDAGISDQRKKAFETLMDDVKKENPGMKDEDARKEAGKRISRAADRYDFTEGQAEVSKGYSAVLGKTQALDAAINRKINDPDAPLTGRKARGQALNSINADAMRKGTAEEDFKAGEAIGAAEGAVNTNEAAIDREMHTMQGDYKVLTPGLKYANGKDVPVGTTLKKGDVLQKGTEMPVGAPVDRKQAIANLSRKAVVAGTESGLRTAAAAQGKVSSLSEAAVAEGTATAAQRLGAYTQSQLDSLAAESATIQAQNEIIGTPMQKGYNESVKEKATTQYDNILKSKVAEAKEQQIEIFEKDAAGNIVRDAAGKPVSTGRKVRMSSAPSERETLMELARQAHKDKDDAKLIAAMQILGQSDGGRDELNNLRIELFGGTERKRNASGKLIEDFDKKVSDEDSAVWDKVVEGVKVAGAEDLYKPESAAAKNMTADRITSMDTTAIKRHLEFIDRLRESYKNEADTAKRAKLKAAREEAIQNLKTAKEKLDDNDLLKSKVKPIDLERIESFLDDAKNVGRDDITGTSNIKSVRDLYGVRSSTREIF